MESESFKRTRRMILFRVLLVPFITVMIVCTTLVYFFAVNLRGKVADEMVRIADGQRRLIDRFLVERRRDLAFSAAQNLMAEYAGGESLAPLLAQLQEKSPAFFDLGVFDEQGNHVAYAGPYNLQGKNYADEEWFREVEKKGFYVSDVFLGFRNIPHFIVAVKKREGEKSWYLRATIDTVYFDQLVESVRMGKTGEAYLVNESGFFQTRRRSGGTLMEEDPDRPLYRVSDELVVTFSSRAMSGDHYLFAVSRLAETGWLLVVRQENSDAYAPLTRAVLIAVSMVVGGGAVVVVMAFILASGLANRLSMADMEKRQMGSQLIMAGKMAEVGEMSSGLAHEINNPLQVMRSEQAMIEDILSDVEKSGGQINSEDFRLLRDSVNQISLQIDRCKNITQGLLKFARKSETQIVPIEVGAFIKEISSMVEHRAQLENIQLTLKIENGLPPLVSDPNQLQQVLLNLLNNAIYALKENDEGEILVTAARDGSQLILSVADNGCGISPENLAKIFIPFFTTKPVGQGTGLGLSTVYGIVDRLGGEIAVASEVDSGTVFTVRLPFIFEGKGRARSNTEGKEKANEYHPSSTGGR